MVALIKCGPDQIIHAGIDDRKFPALGLLDVKDTREKNARVANQKTSWFENNAHAEIAQRWQRGGCVLRDGQLLAGFFGFFLPPFVSAAGERRFINNSHPSADAEKFDVVTFL